MLRIKAQIKLSTYLKSNFIYFDTDFSNGTPRFTMMFKNCNNCPDKILESCVYFYQDCMEAKTYFTLKAASWCKEYQHNIPVIMRLLNYINATLWMTSSDGANGLLYDSSILYTPRIFITEDNFDITITTIINYDFYEIAPLETEDYVTAYCPELLDKLSPAIFSLLTKKITLEQAMQYIDQISND